MKRTFELKVGEHTHALKWGTWAMRLFCEKRGIAIDDFFAELRKYFIDKAEYAKIPLRLMIDFISAGYEAQNKKQVSDEEICEWIDELGGAINIPNNDLLGYLNFVVSVTLNNVTPLPGETEVPDVEKKSLEPGTTS